LPKKRRPLNILHGNARFAKFNRARGNSGETLVIDTIGLNDKTTADIYRTPHTEKMHVVERWRMVDGGDGMEVVFTVEDPDAFYQPWTAMRHYRRLQYQDIPEVVCAENNNQSMFGYPLPIADKPDF